MTGWELPKQAVIGGKTYHLHTDFREILKIFSRLQDESYPEFVRWYVALALFYEEEIPEEDFSEAAAWFCRLSMADRKTSPIATPSFWIGKPMPR